MKSVNKSLVFVLILMSCMSVLRVVNAEYHMYHLVPMAALGLFCGSVTRHKPMGYLIPLLTMFISDLGLALFTNVQGFYGISQFFTYLALTGAAFLGTFLKKRTVSGIFGFTLGGSLVFFVISNLGTYFSGYYGQGWNALKECFLMALPFYRSELATQFFMNALWGDLLFSGLAFSLWALIQGKTWKLAKA